MHLPPPTPPQIASALDVVRDPALYGNQPGLRALAWATLLATRGQRMNQIRIGILQRAQRLAEAAPAAAVQHIAIRQGG